MNITEIVNSLPDILTFFLPGFLFISFFLWLDHKQREYSYVLLWSLFGSILIRSICSVGYQCYSVKRDFTDSEKILIYCIIGLVMAIICYKIKYSQCVKWILLNIFGRAVSLDVFNEMIDYEKMTEIVIYPIDSDLVYMGNFVMRDMQNRNSYLVLRDYAIFNRNTQDIVKCFNTSPSTLWIPTRNIAYMETIYNEESKVWKNI